MKTNKFKILKIFVVICFLFAIVEFILAALVITTSVSDEYVKTFAKNEGIEKSLDEIPEDVFMIAIKIIIGIIFCIEAISFIVEGFLINRAIKKGKTTLIIVLMLIGIFGQLISLISVAIHNSYGFNSASDLASLIIKTIILRQIFEIRRLNSA